MAPGLARIFVSSTFDDMHGERDVLNRVVFPELRSRCAGHGIEFVGIDLRWGLPEDEISQVGIRALCLGEVDACRPFFMALVGDRYGSVPPPDQVPPELLERALRDRSLSTQVRTTLQRSYLLDEASAAPVCCIVADVDDQARHALAAFWESYPPPSGLEGAGCSITELEIQRALFEKGGAEHAFVYMRGPVPSDPGMGVSLAEPSRAGRARLVALKQRLRAGAGAGAWTLRDYDAGSARLRVDSSLLAQLPTTDGELLADGVVGPEQWDRLGTQARDVLMRHGTPVVQGLERFAELVMTDVGEAIESDARERSPSVRASRAAGEVGDIFVGRDDALRSLLAFTADDDAGTVVVGGPSGVGKSMLLGKLVEACATTLPQLQVVAYFVGVGPGSTSAEQMLGELCAGLARVARCDWDATDDPAELRRAFLSLLMAAAQRAPVLLVVDAIDQLEREDTTWLVPRPPAGAHMIVSAQSEALAETVHARTNAALLKLSPLAPADRERLVVEYLGRCGKRLTPRQRAALIDTSARRDAGLPLYLVVALHELTLFGSHRTLTERIERLPPSLTELLGQILGRLEQDHGRTLVEHVCVWLTLSRSGLRESELCDLLLAATGAPAINVWLRLYRSLEIYLRQTDEATRPHGFGLLSFRFESLTAAIAARYLGGERAERAHGDLESYFHARAHRDGGWLAHEIHALEELPYHATHAKRWDRLQATLTDIGFLEAKVAGGMVYGLLQDVAEAVGSIPPGHAGHRLLCALERGLRAEAGVLARRPTTVFQQLWNRCWWTEGEMPVQALLRDWRRHKAADRDFRWLRSLRAPPGSAVDEGVICRGHEHVVFSVAFSPDGGRIVSGARDATARIWDSRDGNELACLRGHDDQVRSVAFSPSGNLVTTASGQVQILEHERRDYSVRSWDAESGVELARLELAETACALAASPGGEHVFVGEDGGWLHRWSPTSPADRQSLRVGESGPHALVLSPDGGLVFVATPGTIHVIDAHTLADVRRLPGPRLALAVACSPDGARLALSDALGGSVIVDSVRGGVLLDLDVLDVLDLCWTPDGRRLVGARGDATVRVWDAGSGVELQALRGHEGPATSIAVNPQGTLIASGAMDGTVRTWALGADHDAPPPGSGHTGTIISAARSQDGGWFASGSDDGTAVIWDHEARLHLVLDEHRGGVVSMGFALDGTRLVTGSYDNLVRIWDTATGEMLESWPGDTPMPRSIAVAPDGRQIAFPGPDEAVRIVDLASSARTRQRCASIKLPRAPAMLGFSADGTVLAAIDGLWGQGALIRMQTGRVERVFDVPTGACSIAVSDDGGLVAVGGVGEIVVDAADGAHIMTEVQGMASDLAFTPDGTLLVSESDRSMQIWSARSGRLIGVFLGGTDAIGVAGGGAWLPCLLSSGELQLTELETFEHVAWFPALPAHLTSMGDNRTWFGVTRASHVEVLRLEGRVTRPAPLRTRVPLLAAMWRAIAHERFERGDIDGALEVTRHWGAICEEFGDDVGVDVAHGDVLVMRHSRTHG
jgi:WD40 repeat protein